MRLRTILQYLGINRGDMESGQLRCDANVSLREAGRTEFGTKVEIKNMNSFRAIHRAIQFEVERQTRVLEGGGALTQETRGWNDAKGETVSQRSKEYAHDYRYFPEPDLPPLTIARPYVTFLRESLPELPSARRTRYMKDMGLSGYDASLLTSSKAIADYFDEVRRLGADPKQAANWILGDFSRLLNADRKEIDASSVTPAHLAGLLELVRKGTISGKMAKETFEAMYRSSDPAAELDRARGSGQISDESELNALVDRVIAENAKSAADFRAGRQQAFQFLVGQAMKLSRGRANVERVNALLRAKLSG